jgi:hypothetical protein
MANKVQRTLANLLEDESNRFNGFCYSTFPFSCFIAESLTHANHYQFPANPVITREDRKTTILIPPIKGSRARKPLSITLWR